MKKNTFALKGDRIIWMALFFLAFTSIAFVASSSYRQILNAGSMWGIGKHILTLFAGFVIMYFIHRMNVSKLKNRAPVLFALMILLLAATFIISSGRWLFNGSFQPSELAKVVIVIYLAQALCSKLDNSRDFILKVLMPIGLTCALIINEHTSTVLIIGFVAMTMIFISTLKGQYIWWTFLAVCFAGMMYLALQGRLGRGETAANRVSNWYATILGNDKTEDLQATNAKFAIVSGGLIGKGPGRSDYRRTLTEANNDYIFAIVVEEYGLVGVLILLSVYMTLFFRVIRIIRKCEKSFQALLVSGLITLIMLQAMIHIGVSVGGIPVTGQNLPMISTGGTSIIITCASFGIILSISKETNYKRKSKRKIRKTTTVTNTATAN